MKDFHRANLQKIMKNLIIVKHLSRQNCAVATVIALIQTRNVQLQELALVLNDEVKPDSNEHRLQMFFKEANFQEDNIVFFLSVFLLFGKVDICLDRTEWDFGKKQVNMLVLTASCRGISFPLYVEMLDNKSGNSSALDRINLLKKVIALLGKRNINSVIGDREFVGKTWINYLISEDIIFFLRVPKSYVYTVNGVELQAINLLSDKLLSKRDICQLDNIEVLGIKGLSVGMKKIKDKKGKDDYLIVLTNTRAYNALRAYRKRWSIEVMFQDFKGQGFNLENTHLKDSYKLQKLVYLVAIAYVICIHVGLHYEKYVQKIPLKNHKYRKNSICRKGLNILREMFMKKRPQDIDFWNHLIQLFTHFFKIKMLIINKLNNT